MTIDDRPDPLSPDLRDRILKAASQAPSPTRRAVRARDVALFAAVGCLVSALFFWWGGLRAAPRPAELIIETAIGAACITAVAMWGALGRGKSMVGRSTLALGIIGVATPVALFLWKVVWSSQDPSMMAEWPERPGFRCLRLGLALAIGPLLAMVLVRRHSDPNHPWAQGAALGVASGACAWVFTDLWCPVAYVPHLLLGHILPLVVMAALGAILGGWLIAIRVR